MSLPTLVGRHCRVRALTLADAPAIARHADDEQVWRNLFEGFPRPYTLAHAQAWCGEERRQPACGHVWAIEVNGAAAGCCSVRPDSGWLRCNAEVGYWIGRECRGRGVVTEALGLITEWAWIHLPEVTRLYAPIFSWNLGSQRVAEKCGDGIEGSLRQSAIKAGQVIDRVQYALYRSPAAALPTLLQ